MTNDSEQSVNSTLRTTGHPWIGDTCSACGKARTDSEWAKPCPALTDTGE